MKIKSKRRHTISSDIPEKQSSVYTPSCIESARIEQYHSEKQLNENFQVIPGMKSMILLIKNDKNGSWKEHFLINQNLLQEI